MSTNRKLPREVAAKLRAAKLAKFPRRSWDGQSNGDRLVDHYGHELRWVADARAWAVWDGTRWSMESGGTDALNRARRTLDALPSTEALHYSPREGAPADAPTTLDDDDAEVDPKSPRGRFLKFVRESRNLSAHNAMIAEASGTGRCAVQRKAFDADGWTWNGGNGLLDLRTMTVAERRPDMLLMNYSPVPFESDAACPRWEKFLVEALPDPAVRGYVQRWAGYSMTGAVDEHAAVIHHGPAGEVRRAFVTVLREVFGDYAQVIPRGTLVARRSESTVNNDVARMVGKRLLLASEPPAGAALDDERLTEITDGLPVAARHMRAEFFEFRPVGKLHLSCEHMPTIGGGPAVAAKLHVVEWKVRIPDDRLREAVKVIIERELPGVLAWAARGCTAWQRAGLAIPDAVRENTADHLFHGDALAQWYADRLAETGPAAWVEVGAIYPDYVGFAEAAGVVPLTQMSFSNALVEQYGLRRGRSPGKRRSIVYGVALVERDGAEREAPAAPVRRLRAHPGRSAG